jgi:Domain of unknown function (DUF1937)
LTKPLNSGRLEDFELEVNTEPGYSYLASPYSAKGVGDPRLAAMLRARRYKHVCRMAAELMRRGHVIFCPIAHSHPIEVLGMHGDILDGDFWLKQDYPLLEKAKEILVFQMGGWDKSYGVAQEIKFAQERNIPVRYIPNVRWKKPHSGYIKKSIYWQRHTGILGG